MRIVLIGPPGAGKGTQARFLAEHLSVPAISSGDLFRSHIRDDTALGRRARRYTDAGALVPDELTTAMMTGRISEPDAAAGFLLDGFPRTVRQAVLLAEALAEQGTALDRVVAFDVPGEEVVRRLTGRRTCGDCGLTTHLEFSPPRVQGRCDDCGGELTSRDDDQEKTVRRRLTVFTEQTAPVLQWYGERGLVAHVDATGPVAEVTRRTLSAVPAAAS